MSREDDVMHQRRNIVFLSFHHRLQRINLRYKKVMNKGELLQ
jgi:hypothetical protein